MRKSIHIYMLDGAIFVIFALLLPPPLLFFLSFSFFFFSSDLRFVFYCSLHFWLDCTSAPGTAAEHRLESFVQTCGKSVGCCVLFSQFSIVVVGKSSSKRKIAYSHLPVLLLSTTLVSSNYRLFFFSFFFRYLFAAIFSWWRLFFLLPTLS